MATFGHIKNKILVKLTESYGTKEFKSNLNKYFKPIMKNNTLKEMYSLYEEIETLTFDDKETAQLYVEELSKVLRERCERISDELNKINETLIDVHNDDVMLYEWLDSLSAPDKLGNISSKITAKKNLIEHLLSDKTSDDLKVDKGVNENLLNSVLVNNFNVSYDKTLSEDEKNKLKTILEMTQEDLTIKFNELKETVENKLNTLVESDKEFGIKADQVRSEVNKMELNRYNLFRLEDLSEGLS